VRVSPLTLTLSRVGERENSFEGKIKAVKEKLGR